MIKISHLISTISNYFYPTKCLQSIIVKDDDILHQPINEIISQLIISCPPSTIQRNQNGPIVTLSWLDINNQYHHEVDPAYASFDPDSQSLYQEWYHHGNLIKSIQIAFKQDKIGKVYQEIYYQAGNKHHDQQPAQVTHLITLDRELIIQEGWFSHGIQYRSDGPVLIKKTAHGFIFHEEWNTMKPTGKNTLRYQRHRTDGPAIIARNFKGIIITEQWCYHSQTYRPKQNGPAITYRDNSGNITSEIYT